MTILGSAVAPAGSAVFFSSSKKVTFALISGFKFSSFSMRVTLTRTVALVRSAEGMIWRRADLNFLSGNASTTTSAGWSGLSFEMYDSFTSASISRVVMSTRATIAPEEVETFTPGGMGATLSPTSAIFLITTPLKGARMNVFW